MRKRMALAVLAAAAAAGPVRDGLAAETLAQIAQWRKETPLDEDRIEVRYKYGDVYRTPAEQAARRGKEATIMWGAFDKAETVLPVVARSPYGGNECAASYWPEHVKPELLRIVATSLTKAGYKVDLPEVPPEPATQPAADGAASQPAEEKEPWPKVGWPEDHDFFLVVGLHHEPVGYLGKRRKVEGRMVYYRASRVNAWAILFHKPTGSGFWGSVSKRFIDHKGVSDTLNTASAAALGYLGFDGIGSDNIPGQIARMRQNKELEAVDIAAMVAQTQRADATTAIAAFAMHKTAFSTAARVIRHFNQRGTVQDFRTSEAQGAKGKCVLVSTRVVVRNLLLEQLRAAVGVSAAQPSAMITDIVDVDIGPIGRRNITAVGPLCADDEIVLLAEMAQGNPSDRKGLFWRNPYGAVRMLGKCRVYMDEAMTVAKLYATRRVVKDRRGRVRRDRLRDAGQAAMKDLRVAQEAKRKADAEALRKAKENAE